MPTKRAASLLSYDDAISSLRNTLLSELSKSSADLLGDEFVSHLCKARGKAGADDLDVRDVLFMTHALHASVLELVRRADERKCSVMKMHGTERFVDSVMDMTCKHSPPFDLSVPATCVEVLMEITATTDCGDILEFLDSRMDAFTKPGIRQKSQYTLLRTCNLLLKRLGSRDAALCGRVLVFLAKFLPLTERSGVNIHGSFHVDNMTPLDDVREGDLDAEGRPVDVAFYRTFWGLQSWFADPRSALAPGACDAVMESVQKVLKRFRAVKVTVTGASSISSFSSLVPTLPPVTAQAPSNSAIKSPLAPSSVKYLSSAGLLPLQLRDATFRRTILVQCLILIGWLENPLLKDFASKRPPEPVMTKIQSTKDKVLDVLRRTPEDGPMFVEAISKVLDGEMAWSLWKQNGCPAEAFHCRDASFDSESLAAKMLDERIDVAPRKRKKSNEATYGVDMGVPELTRLWNLTEDNLTMLSAEDRGGFTSLRSLMDPVIEEMNDSAVDDMFSVAKDQMYNWKTLRTVSRTSLTAFAAAVRAGGDLKLCCSLLYPDDTGHGSGDGGLSGTTKHGELDLGKCGNDGDERDADIQR
jgi:THO complex subunit 1